MFQNTPSISNGAYGFSDLLCDIDYSIVNDPQQYGFSSDTPTCFVVVSSYKFRLSWKVIDPNTQKYANLNDGKFNYFLVELLDKNNSVVTVLASSLRDSFYDFDSDSVRAISLKAFYDENYLRDCRVRITSYTTDGYSTSCVFVLQYKTPSFQNVSVNNYSSIFVSFSLSEKSSAQTLSLERSNFPDFSNIDDFVENLPASSISYVPDSKEKAFYRLKVKDFYGTGVPYDLGQIKSQSLNTLQYNLKPENISGAIYIGYDSVAQVYDRQLFVKWARNATNTPIDYEIHVLRSGEAGPHDVYYYNYPKIENISHIVRGTGSSLLSYSQSGINPFYSGSSYSPVFSPSGISGIQWQDHTIFLDKNGSFPAGSYSNDAIESLDKISIPRGSIATNKAYLVYYYDPVSNAFSYSPTGGYNTGYFNSLISGSSTGINYFYNYTGILVAERFNLTSPSGSIVVAGVEPYFYIPIADSDDYQVKVRGVISESVYTNYSNVVNFPKTSIDAATLSVHTPSADNGTCLLDSITQSGHGFVIGDVVRYDLTGSGWVKALATTAEKAEVGGIVQYSTSNSFNIVYEGKITGLSGLTGGTVYFLSPTTSGVFTATEPTAVGEVSKPVLLASSSTEGNVLSYRGYIIDNEAGYDGSTNIYVSASEIYPTSTSGCATLATTETSTNKINYKTLDFDPVNQEYGQFSKVFPNNWNEGVISAKFYWTTTGNTGSIVWGLQALSLTNSLALDTSFGSPKYVSDAVLGANLIHITSGTANITIAGTPTSEAPVIFRVTRTPSDSLDTLASDGKLLGLEISYS